jgi:hypothetical protein
MNQIEIQRRILITVAGLVLLSVILMIIIIPSVLQDTSAGAGPIGAAIGIVVLVMLHLTVLLGFLKAIRKNKRGRPAGKGLNIVLGILLVLFGLFYMDGAFAFFEQILFVSILMFISAFCDIVAALITFAALFMKPKKNN